MQGSRPEQMGEYFLPGLPGQWYWEVPSYSPGEPLWDEEEAKHLNPESRSEYGLHISTPSLANL